MEGWERDEGEEQRESKTVEKREAGGSERQKCRRSHEKRDILRGGERNISANGWPVCDSGDG